MHRSSQYSQDRKPPNNHDTMITDDDTTSRDSGICEMMDEDTPVCFSALNAESASNAPEDSMEIDEAPDENALLRGRVVETSRPHKKGTLRRQKSNCQIRLFHESKNSRTLFRVPSGHLSLRPCNQQELPSRKRLLELVDGYGRGPKIEKLERSTDHYHLEMSVDDDEDPSIDLDMIVETISQQSTSTMTTNFAVPRMTRFNTTSVIREVNSSFEVEELDKDHLNVSYSLQTTGTNCSTSFRRISAQTLRLLMDSMSEAEFQSKYLLVDCRYPFEFNGGHIKHAVNHYDSGNVCDIFYNKKNQPLHRKIPIFYCEFSQKRGPSMAYALRDADRKLNMQKYPNCDFQEMYVLDKGFRNFFKSTSEANITDLCLPNAYVEMNDMRYSEELKKYTFHRRNLPGQSVFRSASGLHRTSASASSFFPSSSNSESWMLSATSTTSVSSSSSEVQSSSTVVVAAASSSNEIRSAQNSTPAIQRVAHQRCLFGNETSSPTNFGRDLPSCASQTPSPHKDPLRQPQWT